MNNTRTAIKKIIYTVFGEKLYAKAYARGKIKDIEQGAMSEAEFSFMSHFLSPDSHVLDIGANYGHYAVAFAQQCKQGTIHAFEPIDFTYQILEAVHKKFNLSNVVLHHAAVSDKKGTIEMTLPLLDFGAPNTGVAFIGSATEQKSRTITVQKIRLDDLSFAKKIDFIKIDVEGHEPSAFEGMKNLLLRDQPIILIEFSHPCLTRAATSPKTFAHTIRKELSYAFAHLENGVLRLIESETPADGYYFLIPTTQLSTYKSLFNP